MKIGFNISEILLQFFVAFLLLLVTLTLLPFTILLFLLLKTVVHFCAKIFRKDLSHFMTMVGTLWAGGDEIGKNAKINVCWYFIFDGHIHLKEFQNVFEERVIQKLKPDGKLMYPELQMYWTTFCNYIFWKQDKKFDLANHVRLYDYGEKEDESDLQLPKDGSCEEKHLNNVLGPLLRKSYKENKSPWELLLVQNFKSTQDSKSSLKSSTKSNTVLILRIHHALVDAYSVMKLIVRDLMQESVNTNMNFPKMGKWEGIGFNVILPLKLSWDMAGEMMSTFDGGNCWNCWSKKEKLSGHVWTSISKPIDMQLIKDVKNKFGIGYNEVLCATSARVSMRLMEEAGQIVPKEMSCAIPFPRAGHPDGLVNHLSWHIFKWPMDKSLTKEKRMRIISKRQSPSKYYTAPLGYNLLAKYCNLLPSSLVKLLRKLPFTIAWTSVPFSSRLCEFKSMGVNLIDLMCSVGPGDGNAGTGMCLLSYNGKQRINAFIDKTLFPSGDTFERFGIYFQEELNRLMGRSCKQI